ncbi:hypothetical protein OAF98_00435 [Planctomicrobium sp.]|jgi:hypothetical protein|nr:hypothetical protein [Planctomicrobium sp.]MDB4742924.1 hypothetical protein [Planctomicrobium sp.]
MPPRKNNSSDQNSSELTLSTEGVREVLGYLNFSSGNDDSAFLKNLNSIWSSLSAESSKLQQVYVGLTDCLTQLHETENAFSEVTQANSVIDLAIQNLMPAYREFHRDLLFHIEPEELENPFFLGKLFQVVLQQGLPWEENERIVSGALESLNDFVGYRPIAVLENGRKMEIYANERHRPLPLFVPESGVAAGPYEELITQTIKFLKAAPQELLEEAHFHFDYMQELSCDLRAYDHLNPANKRTNYTFGEWDPHSIDSKGNYERFVVRQIVLDSLLDWIDEGQSKLPHEEKLFDAAAALCGTMLMASSISGSGPAAHDSTVSLTTLLPIVARRRDEFYARVMADQSGDRAKRLHEIAVKTQQPFGHIRQYLNMQLAGYGARQVQHREIAHLYAVMGYAEASQNQANEIPASSIRAESEIECQIAKIHQSLDQGDVLKAMEIVRVVPSALQRGVECGALVDPWNILGFHGQFPLFSSREDAIPDTRIETLLGLMESIFNAFSRTLGEAGAKGLTAEREEVSVIYQGLADWWDRFGSDAIEDLPDVDGHESWESATHVGETMVEWREAGEATGDISFWRDRVEKFHSAQSYALVVDALLQKGDEVAAMGLLMQWLNQLDEVGFECPQHSIFSLLIRWMKLVTKNGSDEQTSTRAVTIRRLFAFLEANAEEWWGVPLLSPGGSNSDEMPPSELLFEEPFDDDDLNEDEDEDDVFSAAYDEMVFRDSAEDGNWGNTVEGESGAANGEFEALNRDLEPRLKFLNAVGQLWQMAAASYANDLYQSEDSQLTDQQTIDAIIGWHRQAQRWQIDLAELMENVWDRVLSEPFGDHDGNVEYDVQLQVKFYLLHQIINTLICLQNAERLLNGIIPEDVSVPRGTEQDRRLARIYRAVVQRDRDSVRELFPALLSRLSRNPLLYVPLENGGDPGQILRTQALQSVIRFLLRELPRMGMLRETWHLLYTAFRMERKWRPKGQAITEFDRLFTIALKNSLNSLVSSVQTWSAEIDTEDLIDAISKVLDHYQWLWSEHSRTMRISAVDGLRKEGDWEELSEFIQKYGGDLFHASQLTLGNVRSILHHGVDWYLDYLEEEQDPIRPIKLLDDIDRGVIDRDDSEWSLEQIYSIIVDRFDRFLEYNTTTTQSDYGEMMYCLLEFLRLEARYDRDAWNLIPLTLVHEILVRNSLLDAADVWESTFEMQTDDLADRHLKDLRRLQKRYGMRMPTIMDHLRERFVKPLAVNRMLSLVKQSVLDSRASNFDSEAFKMLYEEVDEYLDDSWGSGVDIPDWLRALEREVNESSQPNEGGRPGTEADLEVPMISLNKSEFHKQVLNWKDSLGKRSRTKKKNVEVQPDETPPTETNLPEDE